MQALQKKRRSASLLGLAVILDDVSLAERSLDLIRSVTKREQTLVEVNRNSQVASSAALSAQHSALEHAEKNRECPEILGNGSV